MSAEEATAADGMEVEHPEPAAADGGEDAAAADGQDPEHGEGEGQEAAGADGEAPEGEAETAGAGAGEVDAGPGGPDDPEGGEGAEDAEDAEGAKGAEGEAEKEPADPVFALRDKLLRILDDTSPDLKEAGDILDALMSKWDNIEVPQIVLNAENSLGMIVRRLRKREDEELATRAGRLYDMYQTE